MRSSSNPGGVITIERRLKVREGYADPNAWGESQLMNAVAGDAAIGSRADSPGEVNIVMVRSWRALRMVIRAIRAIVIGECDGG